MSELLIINLASRGRPQQFLKVLQNITDTISTHDYRIIVSIDFDDMEMNNNKMFKEIWKYNTEIIAKNNRSKIEAINKGCSIFPQKFYWLINMSDDMIFTQHSWDEKMLNSIKGIWGNSTDFFAHFKDPHIEGRLPTLNVCGFEYFKRDNEIYHNSYGSICADAENWHKAIMRGRHHYFNEVYYEHIHPANIPSLPVDKTYRRNDQFGKADVANYFERMSYGFYVENPVYMPEEVKFYMDKIINANQ